MKKISFRLNGESVECYIEENQFLIDILRDNFQLTGTKEGCGMGECGACTVIVDKLNINSCLYPAIEIEGKDVTTIEGVAKNGQLSEIQRAFLENGAVQCGFCTPGMVLSTKAFIDELSDNYKNISKDDIKKALSGNICRCTGYLQIIESVKNLIEKRNSAIQTGD